MTQTAERTVPYEVYLRELERRKQAERTDEAQKRTINALQNEVHWLEATIFNSGFNDLDIRLLVKNTPREIRMGLTGETPERKIYLPKVAEEVHASAQTASVHLRKLAKVGAISYRTETDQESGNPRVFIAPCPIIETPDKIAVERAKRGGSTWEDNKRVKVCKHCGSTHLVTVKQIICEECGAAQSEKTVTPVNDPHYQYDSEVAADEPQEEANYQYDSEPPSAESESAKSSCITDVDTLSIDSQSSSEGPAALEELQALPQWVVWRYEETDKGKPTKVPYNAKPARAPQKADSTNPATWTTYEQARSTFEDSQRWKRPYTGVGFVFNHNGIVGIDQDGSLDPRIDSYTELSVSETGIHTYARGSIPRNVKRPGIELYDHARFFCWTGKPLPGTPEMIRDCQPALDALFVEIAPPAREAPKVEPQFTRLISDDEILKKARGAVNSAKFIALYDQGHWSAYYPSQSEADAGLCKMLLYWADGDVSTTERLFEQSGLMREKWNRADYRERTINRALGLQERKAS